MAEESEGVRPKRPGYLLWALMALWVMGIDSAHEGFLTVQLVRDPLGTPISVAAGSRDAVIAAISSHGKTLLPLGIAELVLGGVLVVVCASALFGGRITTSFALQVILAHVLLAVAGVMLRAPISEVRVEQFLASGLPQVAELRKTQSDEVIANAARWSMRALGAAHVFALGLCAVALHRPAARLYLDAGPNPEER